MQNYTGKKKKIEPKQTKKLKLQIPHQKQTNKKTNKQKTHQTNQTKIQTPPKTKHPKNQNK